MIKLEGMGGMVSIGKVGGIAKVASSFSLGTWLGGAFRSV